MANGKDLKACKFTGGDPAVAGGIFELVLEQNHYDKSVINPGWPKNTYYNSTGHSLVLKVNYGSGPYHYFAVIPADARIGLLDNGGIFLCVGWIYIWDDATASPGAANTPWPWVQTVDADAGSDGCEFAVEKYGTSTNVYNTKSNYTRAAFRGGNEYQNADRTKVQIVSGTSYTTPEFTARPRETAQRDGMQFESSQAMLILH
jgi:hypothetical protein